ncbi:hypothetical protein BKA70DRAFT_1401288 [Coprinopsis sp. MPI-PUGE-AT-0042]|nr:hypothetical protein BKA70DRAFT_1401288 [Coprinopsis sp. MPI-PUGE-AT-0042]
MTEALSSSTSNSGISIQVRVQHAIAPQATTKTTVAQAQGRAPLPDDVADLILRHREINPARFRARLPRLLPQNPPFLYADTSFNVTRSERFVKFQRFCSAVILNRKLGRYVETLEFVNENPGVLELHIPMFNAFRRFEGLKRLTFIVQRPPIQLEDEVDEDVAQDGIFGHGSKAKSGQPRSVSWVHDIALSVRTNLTVLFTLPTLTHLTLSGIGMLPFALLTSLTKIEELYALIRSRCKPGVIRRLTLSSVDAGVDAPKDHDAQSHKSDMEGLDDWVVTDVEDESQDEDETITVKNLAKRKFGFGGSGKSKSWGKKHSSKLSLQQQHLPFAKAVWLLIEVADSSFKPINLHFLKHTLRFLTISIWYHRAITSNDDSGILGDVLELCKQLSAPDAVLEQLTIRCLCYDPPATSPLSTSSASSSSSNANSGVKSPKSTPTKSKTLPPRLPSQSQTPSKKPALQRMESASSQDGSIASHSASSSYLIVCNAKFYLDALERLLRKVPIRGMKTTPAAAQPYPKPCPPSSLHQLSIQTLSAPIPSGIKNIDYYKEWIGLDSFLTSKISLDNASLNGHTSKTPLPRMAPKPKPSFDKLSSSLSLGDTFGHKTKRSFKSLKMLRVEFVAERGEAQKEVEELERHAKSVEKWMGKVKSRGVSVSGVAVRQ